MDILFTIFQCVRRSRWNSNQRGPLKQKIRDEVCPNSLLQIKVHRGIRFFERIISYGMVNDIFTTKFIINDLKYITCSNKEEYELDCKNSI